MSNHRFFFSALGVAVALGTLQPSTTMAQGVAISETRITVAEKDVLTMGHATPVYARGTGFWDPVNRLVRVGDTVVVNDNARGLTLTIFDAASHALVSSANYDTWGFPTSSDALATALGSLAVDQIGILTSADAFELAITQSLRAEARRLGLFQLAGRPSSLADTTWRHPYAAIFHGSGASTSSQQALEILQPNTPAAPHAIVATWLIADGFVGQTLIPADYLRCSGVPGLPGPRFTDCGDGTVVDNHTGLFWLKNASCAALAGTDEVGRADFGAAFNAAKALANGTCGLSDGSQAGDWRLANVEEYCSLHPGLSGYAGSPAPCAPWAITNSLVNVRYSNPAISNAEGSAQWSEGDPFVGVQSAEYWTKTVEEATAFWSVSLLDGSQDVTVETENLYVWPVRGAL